MIEEIVTTSKKIANINITNKELINLLKNENEFNYLANLHNCNEKHIDDNDQFANCILTSVCPEETSNFKNCVKYNKDNSHKCVNDLFKIQDCMRHNTNCFISIIQKTNKI